MIGHIVDSGRLGDAFFVKAQMAKKDKQEYLVQFDHHWDNPKSDHDMMRRHLDEAVERGAGILWGGDTFCLMQGRYDPRRSRNDIRPEHDNAAYLDSIVETAAEFFKPYAKHILFMGRGNHELSVLKNCETDIIERVAERLRMEGSNVTTGGIGSYWLFQFQLSKENASRYVVPAVYFHGSGGGGPVTKGAIGCQRRALEYPDARIIFTGHVHEELSVTHTQSRISTRTGIVRLQDQEHVIVPTYKQEYGPEKSTWHSLNGRPPKPLGAKWLTFNFNHSKKEMEWQITKAK